MQDYTHESCNSYKIILRGLIVHIILVLHNLPKCIKDVKIVYKPGLNTQLIEYPDPPFSPPPFFIPVPALESSDFYP